MDIFDPLESRWTEAHHDVTKKNSSLIRRTAGFSTYHHNPALVGQREARAESLRDRHRLNTDAEIAAGNVALGEKSVHNSIDGG